MIKLLMKHIFSIAIVLVCLAPRIGLAGLDGEPAPPLNVSEWIKGQPVEIKPGTNIYVVAIWNTKSVTSRAAITNLNHVQQRYQTNGVVVVAISDEPAATIRAFVEQFGTNNIQFELAADKKRSTSLTYMDPVMRHSIPYAFVVGTNGDLLWHNSPFRGLDHVLSVITSGAYDEAVAKKMDLDEHHLEQYVALARQGSDRANPAGRSLLAERTNDVELLCDLAFQISTVPNLAKRDFALAGQALDQAERLAPTNSVPVAIARAIWLFESGKQDEGLARATQALALTQSPLQISNIQVCIRTMQQRRGAAGHHKNPKLDAPPAPNPVLDSNTNQSNAGQTGQGASAAGNPQAHF
jgi:hypothetical protein